MPIRIIREWSKAPKEPVIAAQEEVGDTKAAGKGGKKPTTPAPEEPKVPGPPVQVLIDSVTWLNAAVDVFQDAAAASSEIAADHFINLLKHPSALVVDASLALFKSMLRLEVLLHALVTVRFMAYTSLNAVFTVEFLSMRPCTYFTLHEVSWRSPYLHCQLPYAIYGSLGTRHKCCNITESKDINSDAHKPGTVRLPSMAGSS